MSPFRDPELVVRERRALAAELRRKLLVARAKRWELRRRAHPIFWTVFSKTTIVLAIGALLVGGTLDLVLDEAWTDQVCRVLP